MKKIFPLVVAAALMSVPTVASAKMVYTQVFRYSDGVPFGLQVIAFDTGKDDVDAYLCGKFVQNGGECDSVSAVTKTPGTYSMYVRGTYIGVAAFIDLDGTHDPAAAQVVCQQYLREVTGGYCVLN